MQRTKYLIITFLLAFLFTNEAVARNETIRSFSKAKEILLHQIYTDHQTTIYCDTKFDS
jgi:deoxyribonuclease I